MREAKGIAREPWKSKDRSDVEDALPRKSTLADVAAQAGVSQTTVSRLLNGYTDICTLETARRIYAAIDLVGYVPRSRHLSPKENTIGKEQHE